MLRIEEADEPRMPEWGDNFRQIHYMPVTYFLAALHTEEDQMDVTQFLSGGNYLKAADLQGKKVNVVIERVRTAEFNEDGDVKIKPVIAFHGKDKELVCNPTNLRVIVEKYGTDSDTWIGKELRLYSARVPFRGNMTDAIRVEIPVPEAPGDIPF